MIRLHLKTSILLLATLGLAITLSDCGGGSSATPTASPTDSATPVVTATPTPSPPDIPATAWQLGAPVSSEVMLSLATPCSVSTEGVQVQMRGTDKGNNVSLVFGGTNTGDLQLSDVASKVGINLKYGALSWFAQAGAAGASGTVTIDVDGSGSMQVIIPPFAAASGGAKDPINLSGSWTCS